MRQKGRKMEKGGKEDASSRHPWEVKTKRKKRTENRIFPPVVQIANAIVDAPAVIWIATAKLGREHGEQS